jgi:hypothetical protein
MAAVAACALIFALAAAFPGWSERRRSRFQITFDEHAQDHQAMRLRIVRDEQAGDLGAIDRDARRREYHAAMKAKYAWAARLPWLPVMPDPPVPE